jgi:hypothetical protein
MAVGEMLESVGVCADNIVEATPSRKTVKRRDR